MQNKIGKIVTGTERTDFLDGSPGTQSSCDNRGGSVREHLWQRFIGKKYGTIIVKHRNLRGIFSTQCSKCRTNGFVSYNTLWHSDHKNRSLNCKYCSNPVGKEIGGILIAGKIGYSFIGICDRNHAFKCSRPKLARTEKLKCMILCPGCMLDRKMAKALRPKKSTIGLKKNRAWHRWQGMKTRVKNGYSTMCDRWRSSVNFLADMGNPPPNTVLDRIDNSKGYEPSNCRWSTYVNSTENRSNTVWLYFGGEKLRVIEFAKKYNQSPGLVYNRLRLGWTIAKIAQTPLARRKSSATPSWLPAWMDF